MDIVHPAHAIATSLQTANIISLNILCLIPHANGSKQHFIEHIIRGYECAKCPDEMVVVLMNINAVRTVCGAGSMQQSGACPSVRLSRRHLPQPGRVQRSGGFTLGPRSTGPSISWLGPQIQLAPKLWLTPRPHLTVLLTQCGQLIFRKISKSDTSSRQILRLKCKKNRFPLGLRSRPCLRSLQRSPRPSCI